MTVDNFAACCCSPYIVLSIAMSFEIITEQRFLKEFKGEKKARLHNT